MLSKTWRIVLLVVALVAMIWPDLIGASTWWVALIAVTALLINEITSETKRMVPQMHGVSGKRRSKRR